MNLVRDILYINGQSTTRKQRRSTVTHPGVTDQHQSDIGACLTKGVESARHRKRDRDSLGSVLISMNLSASVLIVLI